MSVLNDKTILITGGTGSFGNKITEIILREYEPHSIRILSRGELLQMQMREKFKNERKLRFLIGDVRDRDRVYRAMNNVDIVIHAAAMKQVPACEYNPLEAVRTNIDGAANIIDSAIDNKVEKVIVVSSDKAVHPVNLYGATKMVAEKLFTQANVFVPENGTPKFSCVRYGNVVGSRGSVVPVFMDQRESGTFTITDPRMTRFWITLEQGARFVIRSIENMVGGEIFIPKIPSMEVIDLAKVIGPSCKSVVTGIRPGEKLHEVLITEDESRHTLEFNDHFIIEPEFPFWTTNWRPENGGKRPAEGFRYSSSGNSDWISKSDLIKMLKHEGYDI